MKKSGLLQSGLILTVCLIILTGCGRPAARPIPLRDFFRNPEQSVFRLSPDGRYLALLKPYQNRLNLHIQLVGSTEAARITAVTERDIAQYFWKGNEHLIYLKDNKGDENYHLFAIDRAGKQTRDLTPFPGVRATVIDDLPDDDRYLIIGLNQRHREVFDAYRLDILTSQLSMIASNPGNIIGWDTDHAGKLRLAMTTDGLIHRILFRKNESQPFVHIVSFDFRDDFDPLFFTFDNQQLYVLSNLGRDKDAVVRFDPITRKEVEVIFSRPDVDVDGLSYSRKRKVLLTAFFTTWKLERKFFDRQIEKYYEFVKSKFPSCEVRFIDNNKNEDRFIVRTFSDRSLGSAYLFDAINYQLTKLADISPWLEEDQLSEMQPVSYSGRDGFTIHGYLTLPKGKKPKALPAIVLPHGGPWARDVWGYDPEIQFLANRGYAVLQMNFRGSTGYGKKFEQAGNKQWGRKMQDDISDGLRWLIGRGIADPKRIGIYGASYGGYAVLAGLAFTPDLYACGVDYVGISNMFTFMKTIPPYWKPDLAMMYERVGDPVKDRELLEAVSPVFHVDKIRAPLLVIQGAKDPRVNINESNQIVNALRKRGVAVEYLVKENEGHGFQNEENRFAVYEAMEKFFAKYLNK